MSEVLHFLVHRTLYFDIIAGVLLQDIRKFNVMQRHTFKITTQSNFAWNTSVLQLLVFFMTVLTQNSQQLHQLWMGLH